MVSIGGTVERMTLMQNTRIEQKRSFFKFLYRSSKGSKADHN